MFNCSITQIAQFEALLILALLLVNKKLIYHYLYVRIEL